MSQVHGASPRGSIRKRPLTKTLPAHLIPSLSSFTRDPVDETNELGSYRFRTGRIEGVLTPLLLNLEIVLPRDCSRDFHYIARCPDSTAQLLNMYLGWGDEGLYLECPNGISWGPLLWLSVSQVGWSKMEGRFYVDNPSRRFDDDIHFHEGRRRHLRNGSRAPVLL